jgi:uncharacterized membrane protein YdjX (TVP38/TMEM64 family)
MDSENSSPPGSNFDWRLAGTIVVGIAVLGFVGGLYLFGQEMLNLDGDSAAERFIGAGRGTVWAPIVAVLAFVLLGLTGFPQFVMIAAAVVLFGPYYGFLYSWAGTMLSANVGFALGQIFGADILRRFGGDRANAVSSLVGKRGILASAVVRVVPSAPFIVVNMAAGVSHISLVQFNIGTGIGIIPKMAFIAFIGGSLMALAQGANLWIIAAVVVVLVLWIVGGIWLRRSWLGARKPDTPDANDPA